MSKVTKAISGILGELGASKQDGKNTFQNFKYTSYDEFNAQLKPLLKKYGLAIFPATTDVISHDPIGKTKSGSNIYGVVIKMGFTVSCEGEEKLLPWVAQGRCESGKEIAKAQTEGMKRFEMKLFHASTKNDIDPDGEHIVTGEQEGKKIPIVGPKINATELKVLLGLVDAVGTTEAIVCKKLGIANFKTINKEQYSRATSALNAKCGNK